MVSPESLALSSGAERAEFPPSARVVVGRSADADFRIVDDRISRRHLAVAFDPAHGWVAEDLGSANGMVVDGRRVSRAVLRDGLEIALGERPDAPRLTANLVPADAPGALLVSDDDSFAATVFAGEGGSTGAPPAGPARQRPKVGAFVVGSADGVDLRVDDVLVSRSHAQIIVTERGAFVEDLGSLNGTFVNGVRVTLAAVADGDRVTVGNTDLVVAGSTLRRPERVGASRAGLVVRRLEFRIPSGKPLIRDVDLVAAAGTLTAVIGPSGAGKSTLSRVVTGLETPSSGTVHFHDFDVHAQYEIVRSRIGLVPQDDVLHTSLTVDVALRYAARLRLPGLAERERAAQIERVIQRLGLDEHRHTRIDRLSGGQRKRASVALELLTEPSLLILDEPTSGLDPALDRQVMALLRRLADGDRAVLVVTHSVAHLDECDQILVLAPGGLPAYLGPRDGVAAHFGTDDWSDIFASLAADPAGSHARFRAYGHVEEPPPPALPSDADAAPTRPHPRVWLDQFLTLSRRQVALIFADRGYLVFLAALPILVGLLILAIPGGFGLRLPTESVPQGELQQGQMTLAMLIIGSTFMGASLAVRDLVGERAIFLREKAVGLPVAAYLASKSIVLGGAAWVMAGLLTLVVVIAGRGPDVPALGVPVPIGLLVALGATAASAMCLGLLISALVRSSEQAMPLLIIVLMAQLMLCGGLISMHDSALDVVSRLATARWGLALAAVLVDVRGLSPSVDDDPLWLATAANAVLAAAALAVWSGLALAGVRIRLERRYAR